VTDEPATAEQPRDGTSPAPAPAPTPPPVRWWRIGALVVLIVGLLVLGQVTGLTAYLTTERIRTVVQAAGWWGALLLIALFCVGELVHVPGFVFVAAAVIAYGRLGGGALGYVGALCSVTVSFFVVRGVGGKPLGAIRWRFVQRILGHLDEHPVRTITILRLVLWMAPQLNYALALSRVRYRDYILGSALGLALPVAGMALLLDKILN